MRNRDIKKSFYLNAKENQMLKQKCLQTGLSESNFFRMCILGEKIKEKPDESFFDMLDNLRGIATNINQIAKSANSGYEIDARQLNAFETEVKKFINDLRESKNRILYDRPAEPNYNANGKRYIANKETCEKMLEIRRTRELKKLPLLYLLFCLLLKIDPLPARMDFGNVRVPLTKEMKIELKYMNQLSRQAVLLSKNKISSLDDLNSYRGKLEDEVRTLKGTRENLQRKKRKSVKQEDIDDFDKQLKELAPRIKSLNEDIQKLYMIERRTILWKKEADKTVTKERHRLEEIERSKIKGKSKKYVR